MPVKHYRSTEDILLSGIVQLNGEASKLVPLRYHALRTRVKQGRLRTFGSPESTEVDHLLEQFRNGFPVLDSVLEEESAA